MPPRTVHDERERWGREGAGIGVLGGPPSQDMVGIDIDTEDPEILAALLVVLPPTLVKKVGAKGETCFYHGPGVASQSWSIAGRRAVEIIGPGRQTVLPPTVHPDTHAPYRWLTLDTRQLNEAALVTLSDWVPALGLYKARRTTLGYEAVPIWRPSSTGRPGPQRSRNLKIVPAGIRDFGANVGYTPLDLVMATLGCDLDAAFGFLSQRLGWGATNIAIELPDASSKPAAEAESATQEPEAAVVMRSTMSAGSSGSSRGDTCSRATSAPCAARFSMTSPRSRRRNEHGRRPGTIRAVCGPSIGAGLHGGADHPGQQEAGVLP
jgi:hypothetical protein